MGGGRDKCLDTKWKAQHAVYTAKRNTEKKKFASVEYNKKHLLCCQTNARRKSGCKRREMYTR